MQQQELDYFNLLASPIHQGGARDRSEEAQAQLRAPQASVFSYLEPVQVRRGPQTARSVEMDTAQPSSVNTLPVGAQQDPLAASEPQDMRVCTPVNSGHDVLMGQSSQQGLNELWSPRLKPHTAPGGLGMPSTPAAMHSLVDLPSTPSLSLDDGRMSFCQGGPAWAATPLSADLFAQPHLAAEPASVQAARQALSTWHSIGTSSPERLRSLSGLLNGSLSAGVQEHQMDVSSPSHIQPTHPPTYCPNCTTQLSEAPCITCPYCYARVANTTGPQLQPLDLPPPAAHLQPFASTSHQDSPTGLIPDPSLPAAATEAAAHMIAAPGSQAGSAGNTPLSLDQPAPGNTAQQVVIVGYDDRMLRHCEPPSPMAPGREHPERPARLTSIMQQLTNTGLLARCTQVSGRPATDAELQAVHTPELVRNIALAASTLAATTSGKPFPSTAPEPFQLHDDLSHRAQQLLNGIEEVQVEGEPQQGEGVGVPEMQAETLEQVARWIVDVPMNAYMSESARIAAGTAVEVTRAVLEGRAQHGAAIIRPPGHHAESALSMGFCIYNNAAVAARAAQQAGARHVLIMDWDVHHGNGTQHMFYNDPSVMYISTHRYDEGFFFPGTGSSREAGDGEGAGYTVNVAWDGPGLTDADYLTAFRHVVMPIAESFAPDLVILSAGFDAAKGDPLGECLLTPALYGHLTKMLSSLGPCVLLLEGGYNLLATAACTCECVRVLLEGTTTPISVAGSRGPSPDALSSILQTLLVHSAYWPAAHKHLQLLMQEEQERAAEAPALLPPVDANLDLHFSGLMKAMGFNSDDEGCI